MTILIYMTIGLVIGSVSGVMGIGGGVLLVPALIWLCGFEPRTAAGTSLAILIPPIGLPAAWRAYNENHVDLLAALWIAAAFTVGAYVSRGLVDHIPDFWFRLVFGLVMIVVAVRFMLDSESEASKVAAGLVSALVGGGGYFGLKLRGRQYSAPPSAGQRIPEKHDKVYDSDYQI